MCVEAWISGILGWIHGGVEIPLTNVFSTGAGTFTAMVSAMSQPWSLQTAMVNAVGSTGTLVMTAPSVVTINGEARTIDTTSTITFLPEPGLQLSLLAGATGLLLLARRIRNQS